MIQNVHFWTNSLKNTVLYRTQENICILVCGKSIFYYTVNNNQNVKSTDKCNVYIICLITRNYCRLQICFVQIYISEVPNLKLKRCMILGFIRACLFLLCCFCYFSVCIALWSLFGVSLITAGLFIASALFKKKLKVLFVVKCLKSKTQKKSYMYLSVKLFYIFRHYCTQILGILQQDHVYLSDFKCIWVKIQAEGVL